MPTRCNRLYLLQILLLAQHVSGTIMPIIRSSRVLYRWSLPVVFGALVAAAARKPDTQPSAPHYTDNLKTKAPNTTGSDHLYNTLELLMMAILVPETCWASNKICNKYHLLHLVGILFPHISVACLCYLTSVYRTIHSLLFSSLPLVDSRFLSWETCCQKKKQQFMWTLLRGNTIWTHDNSVLTAVREPIRSELRQ